MVVRTAYTFIKLVCLDNFTKSTVFPKSAPIGNELAEVDMGTNAWLMGTFCLRIGHSSSYSPTAGDRLQ